MSVTFYLIKHQDTAKIRNEYFDSNEPEDPIFNPRFINREIYPTFNYANSNAARLLHIVGKWKEGEDLCGAVYSSKIKDFLEHINSLEAEHRDDEYVTRFFTNLDWLVRVAIKLDDGIAWA